VQAGRPIGGVGHLEAIRLQLQPVPGGDREVVLDQRHLRRSVVTRQAEEEERFLAGRCWGGRKRVITGSLLAEGNGEMGVGIAGAAKRI